MTLTPDVVPEYDEGMESPELDHVAELARGHSAIVSESRDYLSDRNAAMMTAYQAGFTLVQIAEAAGITPVAVSKALGRPYHRRTGEEYPGTVGRAKARAEREEA